MLHFQQRPDSIFKEILTDGLETIIEGMEEELETLKEGEGLEFTPFEDEILNAFGGGRAGGELLKRELEKPLTAHKSEKLYLPNDRHFQLLHRILSDYCDIYNDSVEDYASDKELASLLYKDSQGEPIMELDFNFIISRFFWDLDFNLPIETALRMKESTSKVVQTLGNFSDVAVNASCYALVGGEDLLLKEVEDTDGKYAATSDTDEDFPWNGTGDWDADK